MEQRAVEQIGEKMMSTERKAYDTDLSDEQWAWLAPLVARRETRGRKRKVNMREVVNGLLYLLRTGCQWRLIPHDFGVHWSVMRYYFDVWKYDGTLHQINHAARRRVRRELEREAEPSAGSIDSQSVKTTEAGGMRGFDGGKKGHRTQTPVVG